MDDAEDDSVGCSLNEDPEYLLSLLDKYVKIKLIKDTSFKGFLHSIDPATKSMILYVPDKDKFQITLIPGHAIQEIFIRTPPENTDPPLRKESENISDEEVLLKKNKLISWLKQNLLPVTEEGQNIAIGTVNILPPYNLINIYAENPVVALQIKNIIQRMPDK